MQLTVSGLAAASIISTTICGAMLLFQIGALIAFLRPADIPADLPRQAAWVFGQTSLAKYLPGNVFHYVARHLMADRLGWPHWALLSASMAEVTVVVGSACTVTLIAVLLAPGGEWFAPTVLISLFVGGLTPLWLSLAGYLSHVCRGLGFLQPVRRLLLSDWLKGYALYVLFTIGGIATLFVWMAALSTPITAETIRLVCVAYGVSYVAGFLTPGAPGGTGVREALLILLLSPKIEPAIVGGAAVLSRVSAIGAEVLLYVSTKLIRPED
jgi:hypothetical protein